MADDPMIALMRDHKLLWLFLEQQRIELLSDRWSQLEDRVEAAVMALAQEMARRQANGEPVTQAALMQTAQYQRLLSLLAQERVYYQAFAVGEIERGQREYADLAERHANELLEYGQVPPEQLDPAAVDALAGQDESGAPLAEIVLVALVWAALIDALSSNVVKETRLGRSANVIARSMWAALANGLNHVLNIMRSEQGRIYREVSRQVFRASGVVEGYYRLATRDSRTCPACLADDGAFYPIDTPMPEHRNGRCTQVPAIVGQPAPQWQTGADWFETLAASTQRRILGDGRYKAWRAGQFNFRDLAVVRRHAVYGDALISAPLKDLITRGSSNVR